MGEATRTRGWMESLRNAFALPEESLGDQERAWLEGIARRIVARGMATPAILVLESVKPLGFVGSQAIVFLRPFISMVAPPRGADEVAALLAKRPALEELISMVERLDAEPRSDREEGI